MSQNNLGFFRITVLGLGGSGKTSLINSFVNNNCPTVYQETNDPTLYYKVMKLPSEDEDAKMWFRTLLEIEDTYSSFRGDGKSYGLPRDIRYFLDMSREEASALKKAAEKSKKTGAVSTKPFAAFHAPKNDVYKPLTKGRMGFLLVFDANDAKS